MSKTKKEAKKNQNTNSDLLENPNAVAEKLFDSEKFLEKNRTIFIVIAAVLVLAIGGYFAYNYMMTQQEQDAQEDMFAAQTYIEVDSLKRALKGDGNNVGFEAVIEDYPNTKAANLAHFYKATAHMKEGKYKQAIESLEKFSSSDLLLQARAYCLIGDANMELNKLGEATTYYKKAAEYKPNEQFTPVYLMKLGLAYELQKKNAEAIKAYEEVINKYFKATNELNNAKKYKARLEALMQK